MTSSISSPPTAHANSNDGIDTNAADKIAKKAQKKARLKEVKGRLRKETLKELKPILVGTSAMLCSTLCNQALPRFIAKVVDQASGNSAPSSKSSSSSLYTSTSYSLAVIVIGGGLSSFLRTTVLSRAQDNIASRLRKELFTKLMMDRELEWFQYQRCRGDDSGAKDIDDDEEIITPNSPTILYKILTDDIQILSETVTTTVANTIRATCSIVFSTFHMVSLNPQLLGLSMSIVPIIGGAYVVLNKFVKKVTARQHAITMKASSFAQERIAKVATVKLSSRETLEVETFCNLQQKAQDMGRAVTLAKGGYMGFIFTATSGAIVAVFRAGGRSVGQGRMTHGELKSFVTYTFLLGLGTAGLMRGLGAMHRGYECADRFYKLMDDNDDSKNGVSGADTATGKKTMTPTSQANVHTISISNVSFSYGNNNSTVDTQVLKQASLKIQRGQVVALVGKNGCGKSTLASLLVALYRPQSGAVRVYYDEIDNNFDLYSLDRKTQSSLIQLVPQNPAFFEMSIRDNVTYASPNATVEEIDHALSLSNSTNFIASLKPQGVNGDGDKLDYNVGMDGCNLSAGQRQRLALSRALLSDPPFLIMDEPNTSLDADGKVAVADIVQACRSGSGGKKRGLLLITHRIESMQLADSIVVLKDGVIVEKGTYSELSVNSNSELCKLMPDLQ